jgi:hypothetical protein
MKPVENRPELLAVNWAEVGVRLVAYATWKARNLHWRTGHSWELAAGKTPEDVAAEAIAKVLDGTRAWDPRRMALLPFMQGVVDSLMSHLAESLDNRIQQRWDAVSTPAVASAAAAENEEDDAEGRIERLRAALMTSGNRDLLDVVDAITQGCEPRPQALARWLRVRVADINNRIKRLRRLAFKIDKAESRRMTG